MQRWGDFCTWCGNRLPATAFPRTCINGHVTYVNNQLVGVALQPVIHDDRLSLLVVQRGIEPSIGQYALPGGFVENGETVSACAARELFEEAGVHHSEFKPQTFHQAVGTSATDPRLSLLQFEVMPARAFTTIDLTYTTTETLRLCLISYDPQTQQLQDTNGHPVQLCFPLHHTTACSYLAEAIKQV